MTTRVLLTGAGGFLGSHILEELLVDERDYHVVCVDSFRHNGQTDKIVAAAGNRRERVSTVVHDLRAPLSSLSLAAVGDCQYLINAASLSQVDQSISHPDEFIRNNVDLTLTVMELARKLDPVGVVHISTDEVYGPGPRAAASQRDHRPSSPYAASKAAQDDICHAYALTYDVPVRTVTSANMFGERQSQLAFVPRIIRAALRNEVVNVHIRGAMLGSRQYSYVRNVAQHVVDSLRPESFINKTPGVTHLTGQCEIDNLQLVLKVNELLGAKAQYQFVEAEGVRPGYDISYAALTRDSLWQPTITVDEGLQRTVQWARDNQGWL